MKWLAVLFVVLAAPAVAEIGTVERIEDCLGPRAHAQAMERYMTAPCQENGTCKPFNLRLYMPNYESVCLIEAYLICAVEPEEKQENCFTDVDGYLNAQIADIHAKVSVTRLREMLGEAKSFKKPRIERYIEDMTSAPKDASLCERSAFWPFAPPEAPGNCEQVDLVWHFMRLAEIERFVDQQGRLP